MKKLLISASVILAGIAPALAQQAVTTTNLNVRAGPGSQEEVIGRLASGQAVTIDGCVDRGKWCKVLLPEGEGWVSARYLSGEFATGGVMVTEQPTAAIRTDRPASPGTTTGVITGGAAGAVTGAVVGGPVGAAIGGAAGMIAGGTTGAMIDPPDRVRTYVRQNTLEPVVVEGNVAVGSTLPPDVSFHPIPDYRYEYVYVNGQPVLVEPGSRRIVYVIR
jgi:hypothetical protein